MSKSVFDVVTDVYDVLAADSALITALTGSIYKHLLPVNADGENVVVKCTKLDGEQLQTATMELHLYVPSIDVTANGITTVMPDDVRYMALEILINAAVDGYSSSDFMLDVTAPGLLEWNTELKKYFLNKTIRYQHENF